MPRTSRTGFTLVELLMVVAIIAVLAGLLLPAVQKVRETASRTKCQFNIGQLALATVHHEQAFGRFPAGYQSASPEGAPTGWGWAVSLLPYLEKENLVRNLSLNKSILDDSNLRYRENRLVLLMCPSDPMSETHEIELPVPPGIPGEALPKGAVNQEPGAGADAPDDPNAPAPDGRAKFSRSHYTAMAGTLATDSPINNGILYRDSRVRADEITDGLANTLLFTEKGSRVGHGIWHGALPGINIRAPEPRGHEPPMENPGGPYPSSSLVLSTTRGIVALDSPAKPADTLGSHHLNGANVVFADGHVEYLSGVQPEILLAAWATRAGGEPPSLQGVP